MIFSRIFSVMTIVLMTGCALSPQTVRLSPNIEVASGTYQQQTRSLVISVNDHRSDPVIGTRGGIYRETSAITAASDMTQSLKNSITSAFRILGYSVVDNNADVSVTVDISELKYTPFGENNINAVETTAAVKVTCRNQGYTMNNEYRTTDKQDVLKAPSTSRNQQIINATLSSALQHMFNDQQLLACINR